MPIITLLTDFGSHDYFVGAMKGVILSINPQARVVDITHEIPPQDIDAAAFNLFAVYRSFPAGTVHLSVVDPGVGSSRRPILVSGGGQFFVGPDNGIFSYVCEQEHDCRVIHLTNERFFRLPVSATFHGRDVFAPVAAALSKGVEPTEFGTEAGDYVKLAPLAPKKTKLGLEGRVIHIDRFGNCITNLTREDLSDEMIASGVLLLINDREIDSFRNFFAEEAAGQAELFAIWGSAGFLELAAQNTSAAELLRARRGQSILVNLKAQASKGRTLN
jgi:S-adenosylmethionine hydrolase